MRPRHNGLDTRPMMKALSSSPHLLTWMSGRRGLFLPLGSSIALPTGWDDRLARSKAQIAAGQTVPLLPILDCLRASAERLKAAQVRSPDEASQTARQ